MVPRSYINNRLEFVKFPVIPTLPAIVVAPALIVPVVEILVVPVISVAPVIVPPLMVGVVRVLLLNVSVAV